ncbi:arylsulfatase [Dactylonectria macrodidyma]|uniref:Arylsulfatase n=1 Tax=Dactylonectria macrodidyma TaxID=307937 RepID=A0A9P9JHF7_9HYPO|nr:arylsulfatase [Dactylonectria macrodidyma]
MPNVQSELVEKGTAFKNHFATISNCCPSRSSLFRGQHGHNTNITHVTAPGGNYQKWRLSNLDKDYLPMWLGEAGYRTEYIGKFLNGYSRELYEESPKGWDVVDALIDPWMYQFNTPIFSSNGETPILYRGYHQTDVIRAKAISRLQNLTEKQNQPFYLTIAPVAPHLQIGGGGLPVPLARHMDTHEDLKAPQNKAFNPDQNSTNAKPSWLKNLASLNETQIERINLHYRRRIQALMGVDEIVHDVVQFLETTNLLNNTYIVFSSDNGYHLGQHRIGAGKTLPYIADTNVPFIVRGPGVPQGEISRLPGTHLDLAPTFLDIACVDKEDLPVFLDGRSLLQDWYHPHNSTGSEHRDLINIEFWGHSVVEAPGQRGDGNNSYKALRVVGEDSAWLFTRWCTGETELYNTLTDPFEVDNLAHKLNSPSNHTRRLIHRLNALLLVTKSCERDHCRNPWTVLQSSHESDSDAPESGEIFYSLKTAMAEKYDPFFSSLPDVHFKECLKVQVAGNEEPFLPSSSRSLGGDYREHIDYYESPSKPAQKGVSPNEKNQGAEDQRNTTLAEMMKTARELTVEELGSSNMSLNEEESNSHERSRRGESILSAVMSTIAGSLASVFLLI